jgi:AcrR family transcriptional regulator
MARVETRRSTANRSARADPVDQSGRSLGPRALQTRQRLLASTARLLSEQSVRDLSVVDIARQAGTSPATFYQYFRDVGDATLRLAEEAAQEMPAIVELIDGAWTGGEGLARARRVVEAFLVHWDAHRAILMVRNLAAEEGDRGFQRVRRDALRPLLERLAAKIEESQRAGRVDAALAPRAAAAAMMSILERLAAYHRELEPLGLERGDLVETCARILCRTVAGTTE